MTAIVKSGNTIVYVGDSITTNGWFVPGMTTLQAAAVTAGSVSVTGGRASATGGRGTTQKVNSLFAVNSGVPGDTAQELSTAVAARITNFAPQVVVMLIGINDLTGPQTPTATFRTYLDSIWSQVVAAIPTCQLVGVSLFLYHEQWLAGPVWDNFFDPPPSSPSQSPSIAEYVTQIQASVQSFGGTFVESRSECLAYEAANNTPAPGVTTGILSIDGLHPNAIGNGILSTQYVAQVTVVPG